MTFMCIGKLARGKCFSGKTGGPDSVSMYALFSEVNGCLYKRSKSGLVGPSLYGTDRAL